MVLAGGLARRAHGTCAMRHTRAAPHGGVSLAAWLAATRGLLFVDKRHARAHNLFMGLALSVEELLPYTDGEREKWQNWFSPQPAAVLNAVVQRMGAYSTVWLMFDHIFLVERRHVDRLTSAPALTGSTGVQEPDLAALFHFAGAARAGLRAYLLRQTPEEAARPASSPFATGPANSPRAN